MSCPTCDHTMSCHYAAGGAAIYHCSRCGTITHIEGRDESRKEETFVPMLVERCRDFETVANGPVDEMLWRKLGIAESINLPKDRPSI